MLKTRIVQGFLEELGNLIKSRRNHIFEVQKSMFAFQGKSLFQHKPKFCEAVSVIDNMFLMEL